MTKKQEPQIKKVCKHCLKFGDTKGIVVCDDKFTVNCPAWPPQPATCTDCGHKAHPDSLCYHTNDAGSFDCKCDLQPEKQAKPFERYDKYWVMKLADIDKYLTQTQKDSLADIIHIIQDGRGKDGKIPCNSYVVVKEGLPYTEQVWQLIEDYETRAMAEKE